MLVFLVFPANKVRDVQSILKGESVVFLFQKDESFVYTCPCTIKLYVKTNKFFFKVVKLLFWSVAC